MHGEGFMVVSIGMFSKWALELKHNIFDKNDKKHTGCLFPTPWSTMRHKRSGLLLFKWFNKWLDKYH